MVSTLSIGMMVGGVAKNSKSASVIASVLYFPTLIFSGATLPFEVMPPVVQKIVSIFPLTQGIELMKSAFLGLPINNMWLPVAVMAAVTTELVFMEPVTTVCEHCGGTRYSEEALKYSLNGKTIVDVLNMSVEDAVPFFKGNKKISDMLGALMEVGLSYISLGQPLSTFSGGERQRVKLAQNIRKKGNIYILDEPTTGLHAADIEKVVNILEGFVDRGNTVIVIEHNTDVMKLADYIIDIGPDGGTKGGEVVFTGTPREMLEKGNTITAKYLRK